MAKNRRRVHGRYLELNVSAVKGTGTANVVKSGDPIAVGALVGVATSDEDANGLAGVDLGGVYALTVYGHDGTANAAVAVGTVLYYLNTWASAGRALVTGPNTLPRFGVALAAVAEGAETSIEVRIGY